MLNNGDSCVLLGIKEGFYKSGIKFNCDDVEKYIIQVFENIKANNSMRYISFRQKTEQLGNGKTIGIIIADSNDSRLWINEKSEIYIYDERVGYKLATIREAETIIRERILTELRDFEEKNNDNILDAMLQMHHVLNPISKYSLYDKIKSCSAPIQHYFKVKPMTNMRKEETDNRLNGKSNGNVYYTTSANPRLDDAYLRYSCPVYQNDDDDYLSELFEVESPAIAIALGGGCHLIDSNKKCYFECNSPAVLLIPNQQFYDDNLSLHNVFAWLKSDCFIWTCIQKSNDIDLFSPKVLLNGLILYRKEYNDNALIKNMVEEILTMEKNYLSQFPDNLSAESDDDFEKITDEHNESIAKISFKIERIIKNYLEISNDENDMIDNDLVDRSVFLYNENEKKEVEEKEAELSMV